MSGRHRPHQSPAAAHSGRPAHGRSHKRNLAPFWVGIAVVVILAFAAAFALLRPRSSTVSEITAAQAYAKYQAGAVVVDVRTQNEWNQGHIAKSLSIPLDELPNRLDELPKGSDIVVVCHTGVRARDGANLLLNAGFTRVSCLSGGLQAWVDAGYPVQQ